MQLRIINIIIYKKSTKDKSVNKCKWGAPSVRKTEA